MKASLIIENQNEINWMLTPLHINCPLHLCSPIPWMWPIRCQVTKIITFHFLYEISHCSQKLRLWLTNHLIIISDHECQHKTTCLHQAHNYTNTLVQFNSSLLQIQDSPKISSKFIQVFKRITFIRCLSKTVSNMKIR